MEGRSEWPLVAGCAEAGYVEGKKEDVARPLKNAD
jgi:hypothetical protein